MENIGEIMYQWARDLFPINRSITGPGVRETLKYLKTILPDLQIKSVPTGYKAFDWTVPKEWFIKDAYIEDESGNRIIDFKLNNLHVVGYSQPIDKWLKLEELDNHLFSIENQPTAIPYVTSYYKKRWGFCLTHNQRKKLKQGLYHAVINSEHKQGVLNYAELLIPGISEKEIFLSTYVCHPSMANNEISGPVVATALAKWIISNSNREYTYRIVFVPETIGSIVYLSKNIDKLKSNVIAGYNISCVGDNRTYSFLPSRKGNTLSDKAALNVLKLTYPDYKSYSWLERGSDERQYCSPGVDLPIASIMRSKYGDYPEYHTSLDNLDLISSAGLEGAYNVIKKSIIIIEENNFFKSNVLCEPQLGKHGLYSNFGPEGAVNGSIERNTLNLLSYSDGKSSLLEISEILDVSFFDLLPLVNLLVEKKVLTSV